MSEAKQKVDNVEIERNWMGYSVTAYVDNEQVGDTAMVQNEIEATLYVSRNYELRDE